MLAVIGREFDDAYPAIAGLQNAKHLERIVAGAVVDIDDFAGLGQVVDDRGKRRLARRYQFGAVEDWNDHGNARRHSGTSGGLSKMQVMCCNGRHVLLPAGVAAGSTSL